MCWVAGLGYVGHIRADLLVGEKWDLGERTHEGVYGVSRQPLLSLA